MKKLPGFRATAALLWLAAAVAAPAAALYVSQESPSPAPPYSTWAEAATNIQQAIDAAASGDEVVVTNGVYSTGGRAVYATMTNRVLVNKRLTLRSLNGPQFTFIQGAKAADGTNGFGAIRCVYLATGATLSGFTLTNGATRGVGDNIREMSGGGVWCASTEVTITNCVLTGNSAAWIGGGILNGKLFDCTLATNSAGTGGGASGSELTRCSFLGNAASYGGGVDSCTLFACTLQGNSARQEGGGAWSSTLYNCLLTTNSANQLGGGTALSRLYNCTLAANSALQDGGGASGGSLYNCIVYFNESPLGANYSDPSYHSGPFGPWTNITSFQYSCTIPLPPGRGNIDKDPLFVKADTQGYQLRADSPCIGAGTNITAAISTDLLGFPRTSDATATGSPRIDLGAYQFRTGASTPYQFSPLTLLTSDGLRLTIQGDVNSSVRIERSHDLVQWEMMAVVPIPASGQTLIDPAATTAACLFYRAVRVP